MDNKLVSVLIPCFNTEGYLYNCLNSIISQTYKNIEILILNDGSTDNSLEIMKEFQNKDDRIHIISRENKGVAISRNELIEKSLGDYITFVDSDDYISDDYISSMMEAIEKTGSEMACCNVKKVYDYSIKERNTFNTMRINGKIETLIEMLEIREFYDYPVAKLFKKKCIENVKFPENRVYEDTAILFKFYYNINKSVVIDKQCYFYVVGREGSITTKKYTSKNLHDNYLAIHDRYEFLIKNVSQIKEEASMCYLRNALTLIERVQLSGEPELVESDIVKEVIKDIKNIYPIIKNNEKIGKYLDKNKLTTLFFVLKDILSTYNELLRFINK